MALQVSTEQRLFKEVENLNNSLEIRPELKIANFLFPILRIFCNSIICFSELLIL